MEKKKVVKTNRVSGKSNPGLVAASVAADLRQYGKAMMQLSGTRPQSRALSTLYYVNQYLAKDGLTSVCMVEVKKKPQVRYPVTTFYLYRKKLAQKVVVK